MAGGRPGPSLAWNVGSLIGWRVVQGIGGGFMLPLMTGHEASGNLAQEPGRGRRSHRGGGASDELTIRCL